MKTTGNERSCSVTRKMKIDIFKSNCCSVRCRLLGKYFCAHLPGESSEWWEDFVCGLFQRSPADLAGGRPRARVPFCGEKKREKKKNRAPAEVVGADGSVAVEACEKPSKRWNIEMIQRSNFEGSVL